VIVAGACGIAAGTPLAILAAIGRAARLGAIIKGGLYLETLGRVDTVVLDKTGTLTLGRTEVQAVLATQTALKAISSKMPQRPKSALSTRSAGRSSHAPERWAFP
jgi:P-type E1-E2 ATPase